MVETLTALGNWNVTLLLLANDEHTQKIENQEKMSVTEFELS